MDDRTFVDILRDRAQVSGDKIAYRFLVDGDKEELTLTYGQLHQRSLAIASQLKDEAKPGDRALLLYPPGTEFICAFFGCLYAGVIAVPAYPPGRSRLVQNLKRLELLSRDCSPTVVLCDDAVKSVFSNNITTELQKKLLDEIDIDSNLSASSLELLQAKVICTLDLLSSNNEAEIINVTGDDLAFLQYTSGSTGSPKGVMVSHRNLQINASQSKRKYNHTSDCIMSSWLPQYHDMGLIGSILQPLFCDMLCIMIPPAVFIRNPYYWLKSISNYGVTTSGAPNFAYDLCVNKISEEKLQGLDLSSWRIAYSGAEPIRKETIDSFVQKYEPYGFDCNAFFPVYGMAEHTLLLSAGELGKPYQTIIVDKEKLYENKVVEVISSDKSQSFVSCGKALDSHCIVIVNPETYQVNQDNDVGEIWCQGGSVTQGYWGNEKGTEEIFQAYTADGQGPFLRTGDLGFMKDGELYIVGRLKDMIIIRGRNYAPQDIECAVESAHEGVKKGSVAAFSYEESGVEKLAVVCEVRRVFVKEDHDQLMQAIIENISRENELSVSSIILLKPGQIFKTTSGKIQRKKNQYYLNTVVDVLGRYSKSVQEIEQVKENNVHGGFQQRLNAIIANVSGQNINEESTQRAALMDFGLDSLMLVELQNRIEMEFVDDVEIDEDALSKIQYYDQLLKYLEDNKVIASTVTG